MTVRCKLLYAPSDFRYSRSINITTYLLNPLRWKASLVLNSTPLRPKVTWTSAHLTSFNLLDYLFALTKVNSVTNDVSKGCYVCFFGITLSKRINWNRISRLLGCQGRLWLKADNSSIEITDAGCFADAIHVLLSMFWIFNVEYPYHLKRVYDILETILKIKKSPNLL